MLTEDVGRVCEELGMVATNKNTTLRMHGKTGRGALNVYLDSGYRRASQAKEAYRARVQ